MKKSVLMLAIMMLVSACNFQTEKTMAYREISEDATEIVLGDEKITVNGAEISGDETASVYSANDIVYYPTGKDFTFGEGEAKDEHTEEEANAHTVLHITKPGDYILSGTLSQGQIAVDLGEDAEEDPEAIVTLVLNGVDISCTVAPAVIFYNVYECGEKDEETAKMDVDTKSAGANVVIADGSENNINGSYVARIYKSVELSKDGTEVVDSKKLHKYDAAFYSKMSMNVYGGKIGDGVLNITAENEGLDSELHLTMFSGNVNIRSGNDGINTNEDNISVTTINGGKLNITVTGETGEGDGIDSNGWLVINGGEVTASACGTSGDSGIDSDKGIYINGGTVMASGNMLDRLEGTQGYSVFNFGMGFDMSMNGGNTYTIKNEKGDAVVTYTPENNFTNLVISSDKISEGEYSLWLGDTQLKVAKFEGNMGMGGGKPMGERPEGMPDGEMDEKPQRQPMENMPEGQTPPAPQEGQEPPEMPDGQGKPGGMRGPGGMSPDGEKPQMPEGEKGKMQERIEAEYNDTFKIEKGANYFMVQAAE